MSAPATHQEAWWTQPEVLERLRRDARAVARRHAVDVLALLPARRRPSPARVEQLVLDGGPGLLPIGDRVLLDVHLLVYELDPGGDRVLSARVYAALRDQAATLAATTAIRLVLRARRDVLAVRPAARRTSLGDAFAAGRGRRGPAMTERGVVR